MTHLTVQSLNTISIKGNRYYGIRKVPAIKKGFFTYCEKPFIIHSI